LVAAAGALKPLVDMLDNRAANIVQAKAANCIKNIASGQNCHLGFGLTDETPLI
jgi:hypothetical protein